MRRRLSWSRRSTNSWRPTGACCGGRRRKPRCRSTGTNLPTPVAGLTGWSAFWVALLPWLPSIGFVLLGITLLLSGPLISFQERLERRAPFLERFFAPVRWLILFAALALGCAAIYF